MLSTYVTIYNEKLTVFTEYYQALKRKEKNEAAQN